MSEAAKEKFDVDTNLSKYNAAAEIANAVMKMVIQKCVPGANIVELCRFGDSLISEKCDSCFNKKEEGEKVKKGIAFPTCICTNEMIGHYAPLDDSQEPHELEKGDVVKIDVGAHIGGFPAIIGHTIVCGEHDEIRGRKADVILAAWTAGEAALRALKVGATNYDVTKAMALGYAAYDCNSLHGVLHHEIGKNFIDGKHIIHNKNLADERVDEFIIQPYQAFLIEVTASTGVGRAREAPHPTTIFKRDSDNDHELRTLLARQFFYDLQKHRPVFPFHCRAEEDKHKRNVGIAECLKHYMIQAFSPLTELPGALVARFVFPVLVLPNGLKKIAGLVLDTSALKSDKSIESPLRELLAQSWSVPSKNKKKGNKKTNGTGLESKVDDATNALDQGTNVNPSKGTDTTATTTGAADVV